jgi:hypothetical protein
VGPLFAPQRVAARMRPNCDVVVTWRPPAAGRRPAAYAVLREGREIARVPGPATRFTDPGGGAARAYRVTALDRRDAAASDPAAVDAGTLLSLCLRLGTVLGGSAPATSAARRPDLQVVVRLVSRPVVAVGGHLPVPAPAPAESPSPPGLPLIPAPMLFAPSAARSGRPVRRRERPPRPAP